MANESLLVMAIGMAIMLFSSIATGDHRLSLVPTNRQQLSCQGSMGECMSAEEEFQLDTEINHRILVTSKHISYGALQRNSMPCSQRGASYYKCEPGAQANPYNRGCTAITHCRNS